MLGKPYASIVAALLPLTLAACGGTSGGGGSKGVTAPVSATAPPTASPVGTPGDAAAAAAAGINPANFTARVDNPYFPLKPGTTLRYRGVRDGKRAEEVLTVTDRHATVAGAPVVVLSDQLTLNGRPAEITTDWYTQDRQGNVWYFGENTMTLDDRGRVESRDGSWQAGVDGARPGIFMPAHPRAGATYAQEHYSGHAEDEFTIRDLRSAVRVPAVSTGGAMRTTERTPLEPAVVDSKYYVRGIGTVRERQIKGPGQEQLDLVSVSRA
jgi:hypothetical protein